MTKIDEHFVRTQIEKLCTKYGVDPQHDCKWSTPEQPASWEQCAGCVGSRLTGPRGVYIRSADPVPFWCDEQTRQILNTCLDKSLTYIDWLLQLSKKRYRDHASHQLFVGTLGWFLLDCLITDRNDQTLNRWIAERLHWTHVEVEIAWWVTSLLHDHAYPLAHLLQVTPSLTGARRSELLDHTWALMGCESASNCGNGSQSGILEGLYDRGLLNELREAVKAENAKPGHRIGILRSILEKRLETFFDEHVFDEHQEPGQDSKICYDHGILGAANLAALMPCSQDNKILKAAIRAIGIHNGAACQSVDAINDPLAFLLILCDELQEWGRRIVVGDDVVYESQHIRLLDSEEVDSDNYRIGECLTAVFEYPDAHILKDTEWSYSVFRNSKEKALSRLRVSGDFPIKRVRYRIQIPHEVRFSSSQTS